MRLRKMHQRMKVLTVLDSPLSDVIEAVGPSIHSMARLAAHR
jgi:hypothetical protein